MPVSYTHLDVYKRQICDSIIPYYNTIIKAQDNIQIR